MGIRTIQGPPFGETETETEEEVKDQETETETEEEVEKKSEETEAKTETKETETEAEEEEEETEEVSLEDWYNDTQADFDAKSTDLKKQLDGIQAKKDEIAQEKLKLEQREKEFEKSSTQRQQQIAEIADDAGVGEQFKKAKEAERDLKKESGVSPLWKFKEYYSKEKPPTVTDPTTRKSRLATAAEVDQMNMRENAKENSRLIEAENVVETVLKTRFPGLEQVVQKHEADEAAQPWIKTATEFRKEMGIEDGDPVMEEVSKEIFKGYLFNGARSDEDRKFIIQGLYKKVKSSGDVNDTVTSKTTVKALPKGAKEFKITRKKPPPKQVGTKGGSSGTSKASRRVLGRPRSAKEIRAEQG